MSSSQGKTRVEGAKRAEILAAATARFGRDGYEHTKWADIAADVGVGPTALYHYFESKQHCLYVIMEQAIEDFHARFLELTARHRDPRVALDEVMRDCFDLSDHDVLRNRLLVAEQGLLSGRRSSPREEQARQAARARTRDLEFAWASFLDRAMQDRAIPGTTRACSRARSSGSTTASGSGTARTVRWRWTAWRNSSRTGRSP